MGNLCDASERLNNQASQDIQTILNNRKESQRIPPIPTHLQQKIAELTAKYRPEHQPTHSTIWEVQKPDSKFFYFNEPSHQNQPPVGLCSIYSFHSDNQFKAYFKGFITSSGLRESKGSIVVLSNGDYFVGDSSKPDHGVYISQNDHYKYEGDWVCGKAHGLGMEVSKKSKYEGYYRQGKKHGRGKLVHSEGLSYEGEFFDNQMQGKGTYLNQAQNYQYTGSFKAGLKSGSGLEKCSQYQYEGNFNNNFRSGRGKIVYSGNDICYEGQFQKNLPHGLGKMKIAGKTIEGVWVEGQFKAIFPIKEQMFL